MDNIKKHLNKIVISIVLIFIVTFAYNFFNKESNEDITEKIFSEEKDEIAIEILQTLNELKVIEIRDSFFKDDFEGRAHLIPFKDLKDFSSSKLQKKPLGKRNPFVLENQENKTEIDSEDFLNTPSLSSE